MDDARSSASLLSILDFSLTHIFLATLDFSPVRRRATPLEPGHFRFGLLIHSYSFAIEGGIVSFHIPSFITAMIIILNCPRWYSSSPRHPTLRSFNYLPIFSPFGRKQETSEPPADLRKQCVTKILFFCIFSSIFCLSTLSS